MSGRLCVGSGYLVAALLVLGLWTFAGYFPPPSPLAPPEYFAAQYADNLTRVRVGAMLIAMAGALYGALFAGWAGIVKACEGGKAGPLTYMLVLTSAIGGALFFAGMLVILFKAGPFAWDGLLAFWFPAILFTFRVILLAAVGGGKRVMERALG